MGCGASKGAGALDALAAGDAVAPSTPPSLLPAPLPSALQSDAQNELKAFTVRLEFSGLPEGVRCSRERVELAAGDGADVLRAKAQTIIETHLAGLYGE